MQQGVAKWRGAIVLLDQGTNVDGTDEVRYSALGTDSCTNHSLCAEVVTEYLVLFWLYQVPRIMIIPLKCGDGDWGVVGCGVEGLGWEGWGGRVGVGGLGWEGWGGRVGVGGLGWEGWGGRVGVGGLGWKGWGVGGLGWGGRIGV